MSWLIRLAAGVLILWIAFRDIGVRDLAAALAGIDTVWLAAALLSVFLTVGFVVARWQTLLGRAGDQGATRVLAASVIASQVANIVMPFRLGDGLRIGAVARALRLPPAELLGSVAVERLFDGVLLAIVAAALALSGSLPPFARSGMAWLAATVGAALAAAWLIVRARGRVERALQRSRGLPPAVAAWLLRQTTHVLRGLQCVASLSVAGRAFAWSAAVFAGSVLTAWLVMLACGVDAPAAAAAVVVIAVQIGGVVVPIPGALGISQVLTVQALRLWGVAEAPALAYSLVLYLVARLPKIAVLPIVLPMLTAAPVEKR